MFRISRRLDYGVQLMVALAAEEENHPIPTAALAEKLEIPLPFLHQIAHTLMQAGLIKASPGPRGGLRLSQSPASISLLRISETLEGPICLNPCLECGEECPRQESCTAMPVWNSLQDLIVRNLDSVHLDMLLTSSDALQNLFKVKEMAGKLN
ncbi:transcriptional regulator, BadM/Rrf2 family [Longilinea arvoryzae]|uniref:Transcriptional regulator, BadM/Rrf2 family n=1 Tax=Longilinea arvoryzae TaxID=360412 RepID=A0A0S7BBU3_9CHLR|nr:Rrf2 family transcriptional regulator [Longilinea arvoryzae]GAP15191.1 transcriptional regulator, BadM/Rrf2 family [Longilinea arvoryzae]